MKRLTYILAFLLVIMFPAAAYGATHARLIIDNQEVTGLDVPPIIIDDRVMVPARGVFERMDGIVEWNYRHRQVTVLHNNDVLVMTINETVAWLNGELLIMDTPPVIINDRTLIPLRFPAEAFGFDVDWDEEGRAAIINTVDNGTPETPHDPPSENIPEEPTHQPDGHLDPPPEQNYQPDSNLSTDISSTPIISEPHPTTNITALRTPIDTGAMAYTIIASSAISSVNHFLLLDNRLVVDIYNARANISGPFVAYGPVREVRHSQFSRSPYVTRIVFEMAIQTEFCVSLSYDRRTLTIAFTPNNISITPASNTYMDTLLIRGGFQPSIRLSAANYPHYLAIYIDNAVASSVGEFFLSGVFVSHYVAEQHSNGVMLVRVFMHSGWPAVSLEHGLDYVSVIIHRGLDGIRYDFWSRELRLSRDVIHYMDITQVRRNNEYLLNRYTLTLPIAAYGLGLGSLYVADNYLNSVVVRRTSAGYAQLIFETSRVMALTIHETYDEYIIRVRLPQDIHQFIVVIDPGHGGRDPGAVHHGVRESNVVLAISHMVAERLSRHDNIQVYMTRHTDVFVPLSERVSFANQMADLFVSVHANAVNNRPNVSGIETWYTPHSREVGFTSRQFAQIIQRHMIEATGAVDRGARTTPNFVVTRDTTMPAVLLEVGFLSNAQEAARLASTAHQQLLAQAIYEGILEALMRL